MLFPVQLLVRETPAGAFLVRVLGAERLVLYATNLEEAKENLTLLLADRIERTRPSMQAQFVPIGEPELHKIELEQVIPVRYPGGLRHEPGQFSVLMTERRGLRSLTIPALDLHLFLSTQEPWEERVRQLITEHLDSLEEHERVERRPYRREWLESFSFDVEPPPLSAFQDKFRDHDVLPLQVERTQLESKPKDGPKNRPTPTLSAIAINLTELSERGQLDRAYEREQELEALLRLVLTHPRGKSSRTSKAQNVSLVLVGTSGVGKSVLIHELVRRLPKTEDEPFPAWFVDASRLIAGEGWFGDWQRQVLDVIAECEDTDALWYAGSALPLLDAGKHIGSDNNVADVLKPHLEARRLRFITEATPAEWSKIELRDPSFARHFQVIRLEDLDTKRIESVLTQVGSDLEKKAKTTLDSSGRKAIIEIAKRFASDGSTLGAAVHFLRRLADRVGAARRTIIDRSEVMTQFSMESGIPEFLIRDEIPLDPDRIRQRMTSRLIGQTAAVDRMVELISVIKTGMSDLSKPLGSFLFVGPTGVGKTETAKALAEILFGNERRLVRFDMSEYVSYDAVSRFLGDKNREGSLVKAVRAQPFSVVLLDEIEKAHPSIFDVLLQILGEARLTDESGQVADFKNCVVIMTSNLGATSKRLGLGFGDAEPEALERHFLTEIEKFFRPELVNRIDHLVAFSALNDDALERIARRELSKLGARSGLRRRKLVLQTDVEASRALIRLGTDARYGARPLKRAIERHLTIPLARQLSTRRWQNRVINVLADELSLASEDSRATDEPTRVAASKALERIDACRFVLRKLMRTRDFREIESGVQLVERLVTVAGFWTDRVAAEKRLAGFEVNKALVERARAFAEQLAALSDLGIESAFCGDSANALSSEIDDAARTLRQLEIDLFSARFARPDEALLVLIASDGTELMARNTEAYLRLAAARKFSVNIFLATVLGDESEVKKKGQDRKYVWTPLHDITDWPESDPEMLVLKTMRSLRPIGRGNALAISITGAKAAAAFAGEAGWHALTSQGATENLGVAFDTKRVVSVGQLPQPPQLEVPNRKRRTMNDDRSQMVDDVLGNLSMSAHLFTIFQKSVRANIYAALLGDEGDGAIRFARFANSLVIE